MADSHIIKEAVVGTTTTNGNATNGGPTPTTSAAVAAAGKEGEQAEDGYDESDPDSLVRSSDAGHPANLIAALCAQFYGLGWVTGTGGGMSIRRGPLIWFAPTGVQKEQMRALDMFVLEYATRRYLRRPPQLRPSQCTPLFLAAFDRGAGACIHTHSQWAVLVTLLVERAHRQGGKPRAEAGHEVFEIEEIEQIKGIPKGRGKAGMLGYYDRLRVPVIENTAHEEDLTESLTAAMEAFPDSYAVLVKRHGVYVWGDTTQKAKTQCESLDYIFQLAVRMHELGLAWTKE